MSRLVSILGTYQDDPDYMGQDCKPCPEVCKHIYIYIYDLLSTTTSTTHIAAPYFLRSYKYYNLKLIQLKILLIHTMIYYVTKFLINMIFFNFILINKSSEYLG